MKGIRRVLPRKVGQEPGKAFRVHRLHQFEVSPAVPGLNRPVHVHVLPQPRPHFGSMALQGPHTGDVRLLRDPGGVEEEIPLVGPGLLDLASHAVKKRLLLDRIASRWVRTRPQEREAQAVQHAQQRASG